MVLALVFLISESLSGSANIPTTQNFSLFARAGVKILSDAFLEAEVDKPYQYFLLFRRSLAIVLLVEGKPKMFRDSFLPFFVHGPIDSCTERYKSYIFPYIQPRGEVAEWSNALVC